MSSYYNPLNIFRVRAYRKRNKKENTYGYSGLEVYMGAQGKGKTITAIKTIKERLNEYPKAKFITNVEIKNITNDTYYFKNSSELVEILKKVITPEERTGYLIFIDEIHVVLAELFGRTDPIFLTFLSQQRKLSINIIGTSQMYNKLPRVIRDYLRQSGQIILCNNFIKAIQINKRLNMENIEENSKNNLVWKGCKLEFYFHTIELYESYNTFAVISQIQGLMSGELRRLDNELSINNEPTTET